MSGKQTYNIAPKLRFPEFRDKGGWEIKRLGDIAVRVTNRNKDNKSLPVLTNSATGGIVCQQDYFDREIVTKNNLTNYSIVDINDFVYNPRISTAAPVGPISRNRIGVGIMSPLYTIFRFKEGYIDFFEQYFKTIYWHQYLKNVANFGARFDRMNITSEDFMNLPIPFPPLAEQQRIADCLSNADKLIAVCNNELKLLKTHKQGLMQQLFITGMGGGNLLNINDIQNASCTKFRNTNIWEEKKLGEILTINSGHDYKHLSAGDIPVYGTGGYMLSVNKRLSDIDAIGIGRKGTIDKPLFLKAPFWTIDTLFYMTTKEGYDTQFIYYLSQLIPWKKFAEQTGVPSLTRSSIARISVIVPPFSIQKKIASYLLSIDKEIELLNENINLIRQHRQGIMQLLFSQAA